MDLETVSDDDTATMKRVRLSMFLIDTQQGLIYRGVMETSMDLQSHHLSLLSQEWNHMLVLGNQVFYTTLSVPDHFSVVVCQTRDSEIVATELAAMGMNISSDMLYYEITRLDVLSGSVVVRSFETLRVPYFTSPPILRLDIQRQNVFLYHPGNTTAIYGLHMHTWQPALDSVSISKNAEITVLKEGNDGMHRVRISPTQIVLYRDLFRHTVVLFQHTNGVELGVARIDYARCPPGAWATAESFFECVCRPGHRPRDELLIRGAADGCVLCSALEVCDADAGRALNSSRCAAGYKLQIAVCVLCMADEYCQHSQGNACPANAGTLQARGASSPSECVCKPGYYRDMNATALDVCTECSRPFFCTNSLVHSCNQNMSTNENRASSNSSCRCWPGFFETAVAMGDHNATRRACQEIPVGYYMSATSVVPTKCPPLHSTRRPRSMSSAECVCAGGFRPDNAHSSSPAVPCLACSGRQVCAIASPGVVGTCDQYKQVVNFKHDACVCEGGFYDEMATQVGGMRCVPCPVGFYCPQERDAKIQQTITKCPFQTTSHPATASLNGCFCEQSDRNLMASTVPPFALRCLCASSHYESGFNSRCIPCPKNMFVSVQSMLSSTQPPPMLACACVSGFYPSEMVIDSDNSVVQCTVCPVGHFCPAGQTSAGPNVCPSGTFGPAIGQGSVRGCLACPVVVHSLYHNVSVQTHSQNNSGNNNNTVPKPQITPNAPQNSTHGTVVDCFSAYTPVYTNRELDFDMCTFVFVVLASDIKTSRLAATVLRIFGHRVAAVDTVSSMGRIQYSVTLTADFFMDALLAISKIDAIWARIVAESPQNPTLYISLVRYTFCDTIQRIASDLYLNTIEIAVCYMPMDRMTTIGASSPHSHSIQTARIHDFVRKKSLHCVGRGGWSVSKRNTVRICRAYTFSE